MIMLFGGFTDNLTRSVNFYHTAEEGRFEMSKRTELCKGDHFTTNGCFVQVPGKLIFGGRNSLHKFDV